MMLVAASTSENLKRQGNGWKSKDNLPADVSVDIVEPPPDSRQSKHEDDG